MTTGPKQSGKKLFPLNNLLDIRELNGISLAALNRACGVAENIIRRTEKREINPKRTTKARIVKGLDMSISDKEITYDEVFPNG